MNKILYVVVDADDTAYHGHAVTSNETEGADFVTKPSAAHLIQTILMR